MAAHPGMEPHTLTKRLRGNKRLQGEEAKAHRRQQWREASARSRAKKRQLHQMAQQRPLRLPALPPPVSAPPLPDFIFCLSPSAVPDAITVRLTHPGQGQRVLLGGLRSCAQDAVTVAISWVQANIQRLGPWLLPDKAAEELQSCAVGPSFDLSVILPALAEPKTGGSLGVAVAAAVLCYSLEANGLSHLTGCGMTGEVDLAGRVLEVDQLPAKLAMAMQGRLSLVLAPERQARELLRAAERQEGVFASSGEEEEDEGAGERREALRQYVLRTLRPVSTMEEALRLLVQGGDALAMAPPRPLEATARGAGGSRKGEKEEAVVAAEQFVLGQCQSFTKASHAEAAIWVQCCSGREWLTGCQEGPTRESVEQAKRWVYKYWPELAAELGLSKDSELPGSVLQSRVRDLHVHMTPVMRAKSSYVGGAVAVALVSMLAGRPVKPGVAVLGEMNAMGQLHGALPGVFDRDALRSCEACGIRTLVVHGGSWSQALAAGLSEDELQGRLEVVRVSTLQDSIGQLLQAVAPAPED